MVITVVTDNIALKDLAVAVEGTFKYPLGLYMFVQKVWFAKCDKCGAEYVAKFVNCPGCGWGGRKLFPRDYVE